MISKNKEELARAVAYDKYPPWCHPRLTSSEQPAIPGSGPTEDILAQGPWAQG